MKKIFQLMATLFIVAATSVGFVSCSDDDDDEGINLGEQPFESISGKYGVNNTSSGYESIELTSSGSYIVTKTGYSSYSASMSVNNPDNNVWRKATILTRYSVDGKFIYGIFTKVSENVYNLEGFGLLTIKSDNGMVSSFELEKEDGSEVTLSVTKEEGYASTEATNLLCRTWKMISFENKRYENGKLVYHEKYTVGKDHFDEFYCPYYEDAEEAIKDYLDGGPVSAIFSKAGTYIVTYNDGSMACSSWKWKDESKHQLCYDWDANEEEDVDSDDYITIFFSGNRMTVTEAGEEIDEYDDERTVYKYESITVLEALY